jgi:hypothetical protein
MVAGHLDHLGRTWELMPGANDNATAVAVGLGVAEAMAKVGKEGVITVEEALVEILRNHRLSEKGIEAVCFLTFLDILFFLTVNQVFATSLAHSPVSGFLAISLKYSFQETFAALFHASYFLTMFSRDLPRSL